MSRVDLNPDGNGCHLVRTGHLYRFDIHYPGDAENAATDGAWLYYTVRG